MRPDLDDFEELNEGNAPRSRAMSWLVLVVAVGGFVALAYYAYHSGSQSMRDGQVLVVQADKDPIKSEPVDAGGEHFANQDKTIYDAITPDAGDDNKAEKLLPEAEAPVIPQPAVGDAAPTSAADAKAEPSATTFVNKSLTANNEGVDPVDAQSMKQPAPAVAPEMKEAPKAVAPAPVKAAPIAAAPVNVKEVPVASIAAPKMVNVKKQDAPKTKPAAAVPAASSGAYQVQLGAFKSEAEAKAQWVKIFAKNSDVLKGSPIVVKADLPNGTFYRLRAGGFSSSDAAKAACAKLSAKGQACFPAGK